MTRKKASYYDRQKHAQDDKEVGVALKKIKRLNKF